MNPYPLTFRPVLKQTIWGGRRLGQQLGKPIGDASNYAESWEVVDHGSDQSIVADGPLAGQSLADVITDHADWLLGTAVDRPRDGGPGESGPGERGPGESGASDGRLPFPLLLKYLDCNRVLSVQVHPDDAYGRQMDPPDLGKTEAWFIVSCEPESLIYAGLKPGVDRQALSSAIASGETEQVLHSFHPDPGDIVFIPAGTVHALGAGLLVAEIQQSSDTTFRLFDWNRVGADGKPRQLHLQQGLEVSDYQSGPVAPRRSSPSLSGWQSLVESDKFVLQVMNRGSGRAVSKDQFHIVTVPSGRATLRWDQQSMPLQAGATVLLPASLADWDIVTEDGATVLAMHLPS